MIERTTELPARTVAILAAAVFAIFALLSLTEAWQQLERRGFDTLTVASAPNRSTLPITIVGIDEPSFAQVGKQWPWPRSLYGKVVDELSRSGALVIVLDILFPEPSTAAEDEALAAAIRRAGNVVLASNMDFQETAHARVWTRIDPIDLFKAAGAINGFARVEPDGDTVMRDVPEGEDVLWRQVIRMANQRNPGMLPEPGAQSGVMMRYAGPDHTFPYVSFYQALEAGSHLPPDAFKDQIVLVGRDLKGSVDARAGFVDMFASPFTSRTRLLTPGVELHASVLETAILGNGSRPAPIAWVIALLAAVVALSALLLARWRPILGALVVTAIAAAIATFDWFLFTRLNVWLPVLAAILACATLYVAYGGVAFLAERKRKAEFRQAFSLYVTPEVVDHVMAHPERLKLGGERREVTMLFTDLAGFTALSEKMQAEDVAQILNLHFTGATAIVKRNHGTVNRFIGDAVMAMFGAPVEDPEQAAHALRTACEMQEDIAQLREKLRSQGLPEIHMRIGVHSCTAVIGNLGSADRFDYTAIGDGVNLAARLEGVNKLYGTGILVSGETAMLAGGAVKLRPVDRVIVKGKTEPVEILTPCQDDTVIEASRRGVDAYRARRWDESEAAWREVLKRIPDDGVAAIYLERIDRCRTIAPDEAWEAAVELEKM
jgi:adenylate cyclase